MDSRLNCAHHGVCAENVAITPTSVTTGSVVLAAALLEVDGNS